MRRDNLIYAQVGAEAAPPYSTFTVLLLLSGKLVGAAESARPLRAAAAAGMTRARPQRAAKSMVPKSSRGKTSVSKTLAQYFQLPEAGAY